jgi:hypothetical protein
MINIPEGFHEIKNVTGVYRNGEEIVICGVPESDDDGHNCDAMGCSSTSHVLLRCNCRFLLVGYLIPE